MSDHHAADSHDYQPHITPLPLYLGVFMVLMVGTALTVWAAFQDFGPFNDLVALSIASAKGTVVILYFMHVKGSSRLTKLTVVSGFLWLAILFSILLTDYLTRGFINA